MNYLEPFSVIHSMNTHFLDLPRRGREPSEDPKHHAQKALTIPTALFTKAFNFV